MAVQETSIRVSDLRNHQPAALLQSATTSPMTDQYADALLVSGKDNEFSGDNDRLRVTSTENQIMINSAMLRFEKIL